MQEEGQGILGRGQHVPRYIKVSELGESSVAGGEGRQGRTGSFYRLINWTPFSTGSCLADRWPESRVHLTALSYRESI